MDSSYQLLSLSPKYQRIVAYARTGVRVPIIEGSYHLHREISLRNGVVFDYGKAFGKLYPDGSVKIIGMSPEPTVSFPATLVITTESRKDMMEIERMFGLNALTKNETWSNDDYPDKSFAEEPEINAGKAL
jgi:hypothetical protein